MSAPTLDDAVVAEKWAYGGVRLVPNSQDRFIDCWFSCNAEQKATETLFSQHRKGGQGYIIGGVYTMPVSRFGGEVTRRGAPRYSPVTVGEEQRLEWAAEDARARLKRQRHVDEANIGKIDALDRALEPLQRLISSRQTFAEREALLVTIMRRVMMT